jgi:hypothetical protein
MLTPHVPTCLARLGLAAAVLVALLLGWAGTGEGVPEDSPARARRELLSLALAQARARDRLREGLEADLAAGRLPLREAARRLSEYLDGEPKLEGVPTGRRCASLLPGATQEERCARWLLRGARNVLTGSPGGARRAARLERELADAYGRCHGEPEGDCFPP